jgi:hypothetical protein
MSETTGFFVADNKIPLKESYVAIPSQNGLTYDAQKLIEFYIPPNIENFNPKKSYFQFDLTISQPDNASQTRLQLDELIGGQVLIDTIRIHSGDKTELLEEIRHYPVHVSTKYAYHSNPTLKDLRALNEGCGLWTPDSRGTRGTSKSILANHKYSPYYERVTADPEATKFTNSNRYIQCKLKLPLHTGIFQNDKIVPIGLMNGLFVTILTSENRRVFRQLDSVSYDRRLPLNPIYHSLNGSTDGPDSWTTAQQVFYVKHDNNNWRVDNFPLVVGEEFGMASSVTVGDVGWDVKPVIKQIETSGTGANKYIKITLNASANPTEDVTNAGNFFMYSTSVRNATTYNPTYSMSNCELVLNKIDLGAKAQQETLSAMREGKMMVYDFLSTQVYNYSQLKGDRVANIGIPANHSRAKSIICVPTDATVYSTKDSISASGTYEIHTDSKDQRLASSQSGIAGISNRLTEYFFFYDGRNQPSLNVNTEKISGKTSIDAIPILELDKALDSAGMPALQMTRFNENFCIGRALSLGQAGVYDMRNKDTRLNVYYQDVSNPPEKDMLWCNFVYHIRRINIRADSIQVEV